ncbi:MAG: alpha/beta fold hydrolase [Chloroflexota bacterium]
MTGRSDSGRSPLVLLPGTLCDARLWKHQAESLADVSNPQVYDISQDDSIKAIAGRVLKAAPSRFFLAGLSMGGIVAFEIMRRSPERVMALALLDTNPGPADPYQVETWHREISMARGGSFEDLVESRWLPSLMGAGGSLAGGLRATIRAMAHSVGPEGFVRQIVAQIGRRDSWPLLPTIPCPTIVLGGRRDSMCPPALQSAMATAIPHARLAIIEECGHLSTLEQPDVVAGLLRDWVNSTLRHDAPTFSVGLGEHRA